MPLKDSVSRADVVGEVSVPNIIVFGEAGVGKSSVINLIAGQKRAHISNDALGCTFRHQRHAVALDGLPITFWDTTGLDEGSEGRVPPDVAESNLRELIGRLAHSGGIHLVIYCIRGTRLTRALKHNYDLFYADVCRKKVPVALVVTGLEYQERSMEIWWGENEGSLQRYGMRRGDWIRMKRLRELVFEYAETRPWKIEASIASWTTLRSVLVGVVPMAKKTIPRVVIYDEMAPCHEGRRLIGDRQLECEVVYINDLSARSISDKSEGVTVLVFHTSPLIDARIPPGDIAVLTGFYDAAGRRIRRAIVVLRGCHDDQVAQRCWGAVASEEKYRDIRAWPVVDEQAKLNAMIEAALCMEHVEEVKCSGLRKVYETIMKLFASLARWPDLLRKPLTRTVEPDST